MVASALVVLAITGAVYVHSTRAPRARGPVRRTGGWAARANTTSGAKIPANVSTHAPALAVPLIPLLPRGAPFWVSNASAQAGAPNKTGPGA